MSLGQTLTSHKLRQSSVLSVHPQSDCRSASGKSRMDAVTAAFRINICPRIWQVPKPKPYGSRQTYVRRQLTRSTESPPSPRKSNGKQLKTNTHHWCPRRTMAVVLYCQLYISTYSLAFQPFVASGAWQQMLLSALTYTSTAVSLYSPVPSQLTHGLVACDNKIRTATLDKQI